MFNEYQIRLILNSDSETIYENFYKSDLILMIKELKRQVKQLQEELAKKS